MVDHEDGIAFPKKAFDACIIDTTEGHKPIQRNKYLKSGKYPVVDQGQDLIGGYTDDVDAVYSKDLPLILFGDHTRIFKYIDVPFAAGADGAKIIKPNQSLFDPKFLYYGLKYIGVPSRGYNRHYSVLREQEIPCPADKNEQRAIASVLDRLDAAIAVQNKTIATLKELKATTIENLLSQGIKGGPEQNSEIGPIPHGWSLVKCESLCEMITVGIVVTPAKYYVESGVPAFRSLNVRESGINSNNLKYISGHGNMLHDKSILKTGDVLVVRTGYPGTACVVPPEYNGANCIDILIARPNKKVVSHYLSLFLNSSLGKRQIDSGKGGLAQQHFNVGALRDMRIAVPSNIEEQSEIARIGIALDQAISDHVSKRDNFIELFNDSLSEFMSGSLRTTPLLAG